MSTSTAEVIQAGSAPAEAGRGRAGGSPAPRAARRRLPAGRAFRLERVDLRPPDRARAGAGAAFSDQPLRAALRRGDGVQPGQDHAGRRDRGRERMVGERRRLRHPRRDPCGRGGRALRHAHPLARRHGGGGAPMRPAPHQPGRDALPRHRRLSRLRGRGGERRREGAAGARSRQQPRPHPPQPRPRHRRPHHRGSLPLPAPPGDRLQARRSTRSP